MRKDILFTESINALAFNVTHWTLHLFADPTSQVFTLNLCFMTVSIHYLV